MTLLKQLREVQGLSQAALGKKANVAQATIANIELGKKSPTLATLQLLATALKVSVGQLIGEIPLGSDSDGQTPKGV